MLSYIINVGILICVQICTLLIKCFLDLVKLFDDLQIMFGWPLAISDQLHDHIIVILLV